MRVRISVKVGGLKVFDAAAINGSFRQVPCLD
jgi:hypothetical protein